VSILFKKIRRSDQKSSGKREIAINYFLKVRRCVRTKTKKQKSKS